MIRVRLTASAARRHPGFALCTGRLAISELTGDDATARCLVVWDDAAHDETWLAHHKPEQTWLSMADLEEVTPS
jgi:hypothetical protein